MEMTQEQIKVEHEKCKEDILYCVDNYLEPKLVLTSFQREMLKTASVVGSNVIFKPRPLGTKTLNQVLGGWREFVQVKDGN